MTDSVADWLQYLSSKTGIALRLDDDGDCVLGYGEDVQVTISSPPRSPFVFLAAPVGSLPSGSGRLTLCEHLLRQNLFFDSTNGAAFAIDGELDRVILNFMMPVASLDSERFENALGIFADTAEQWVSRIRDFAVTGDAGHAEEAHRTDPVDQQFMVRI